MISLLELPREILQGICIALIRDHGVKIAVQAREICGLFDSEIILAIWTTRALENPDCPRTYFRHERILLEYLLLRTKSDYKHQYGLTTVIYDTVEYISRLVTESLPSKADLLREACMAIVRSHTIFWHSLRTPTFDAEKILSKSPVGCTPIENSLAFAAHLGLADTVDTLLRKGIGDFESDFGYALHHTIRHNNSLLTSLYLQAKLDISLRRAERSRPCCAIANTTKADQCDTAPSRRGISRHRYDRAIRHAVYYGVVETVKVLIDALRDDEAELRICCCSVFRIGIVSCGPLEGLQVAAWNLVLVYAAVHGRLDMAQMALDNNAHPNRLYAQHSFFSTPLSAAAIRGDLQMFRLLLNRGATLCRRVPKPLLSYAVVGGSVDIAKICLDFGMTHFTRSVFREKWNDKRFGEESHAHPLVAAVRNERPEIRYSMLQLLAENGVIFEPGSKLDVTLSKIAKSLGDTDLLALLESIRIEQRACPIIGEPDVDVWDGSRGVSGKWGLLEPLKNRPCTFCDEQTCR